jgi:hypothetical protein
MNIYKYMRMFPAVYLNEMGTRKRISRGAAKNIFARTGALSAGPRDGDIQSPRPMEMEA